MATLELTYRTDSCIPSCNAGQHALAPSEQVRIALKPKNPLWPSYIKAYLAAPSTLDGSERVYKFHFDDAQLNGGPIPDQCDFSEPECYSCCDDNGERINNLINTLIQAGLIEENADGTFNFIQ